MNTYWWIRFRTQSRRLELDQDQLFELGATGTEELDAGADAASPVSEDVVPISVKGFFEDREAWSKASDFFRGRADFAAGEAPWEDWDRSWRDRQTPVEVTPALTVTPPWVDPGAAAKHVIRLEAKMAFGTGSHESTRIAATLLESLDLAGKDVLDIGAGTGILALYAAQLGARSVLALDIDPVTAACLRENVGLNPPPKFCRFDIFIGELSALRPEARFDVIVCNMIRTELWPFRNELRDRLKPGGHFLVSGQRAEDKAHFLHWRATAPFHFTQELFLQDWWGFIAA